MKIPPLETILDFGPPRHIETAGGKTRLCCDAEPDKAFWHWYNADKIAVKSLLNRENCELGKNDSGQWRVRQWLDGKPPITSQLDLQINADGLLPWQKKSFEELYLAAKQNKVVIDASDTGTGKTYKCCVLARELNMVLNIVCPKPVDASWREAAKFMHARINFVHSYELIRGGRTKHLERMDETFRWTLPERSMIVFDEAGKCRNAGTLNSKMLLAAIRSKHLVVVASATLFQGPQHLWALGYGIKLHNLDDYEEFLQANGCFLGDWGWRFGGSNKILKRLNSYMFPRYGTRLKISDIPDFPQNQVDAILVDVDGIQEIYRQMESHLSNLAERVENYKPSELTEIMAARQKAEILKIPVIVSMAKEFHEEEGWPVAIFVNFNSTIEALQKELKTTDCIRGGQNDAERQDIIKRFQANKIKFLPVNLQAGGAGLSLHDDLTQKGRYTIISPSFNADDLRQAIGRTSRAKGGRSIQKIIFAAGGIEEQICQSVRTKLKNMDLLNDGDMMPDFLKPKKAIVNV